MTETEEKELQKLCAKHEIVHKLYEELESYKTDPVKKFYSEYVKMCDFLAGEMEKLREAGNILLSEDRSFERVLAMLDKSEKIFNGLDRGKKIFEAEEQVDKEKKKKIDKATDVAL